MTNPFGMNGIANAGVGSTPALRLASQGVVVASFVAFVVIAARRSSARKESPVELDVEMSECKLCKSHRRTTETAELPAEITQEGFNKPTAPVTMCAVCDSGEGEVDGALALALLNHGKRSKPGPNPM